MQEEALFEAKKCLSRLEKGVSLILLKSLPKPLRGRGCITQKPIFYSTNSLPKPLRKEGMCFPKCFFLSKRVSLACEKGVPSH